MSNIDFDNQRRVPAAFRKDLRIIGETPSVPRALELVRSDLDPKVQARLRKAAWASRLDGIDRRS